MLFRTHYPNWSNRISGYRLEKAPFYAQIQFTILYTLAVTFLYLVLLIQLLSIQDKRPPDSSDPASILSSLSSSHGGVALSTQQIPNL